jgi:hypothetical protein
MDKTFRFVVSWVLFIALLTLANRSRLGHVIIYYSLLLAILLILVAEYKQITPYLTGIQTIGQLDQPAGSPTAFSGIKDRVLGILGGQ